MPVRNEARFIARSLNAILAQDYPADRLEVIVADGLSTDGTREVVREIARRDKRVRMIDNAGRMVSTGLNAAIGQARGEVIVRVDGHCEIAGDYVRQCVAHLANGDAEAVGGSIETIGETVLARAIAAAMSSPFGVGGSAFRTIRNRTMLVDTVPFPAYTRALLDHAGPFDCELIRNQDDEYNYRLRKAGARLLLAADVRSRYYSRSTMRSLWRQYFLYGYYKVRILQKHPRQMQVRQFVPAGFVCAVVVGLGMASAGIPFGRAALAPLLGVYLTASIVASLGTARRHGWKLLPWLPMVFSSLHFSYGTGFLCGQLRFLNRWFVGPPETQLQKSGV
jgi:glycosyltransferase involved in cell wall biosynthesis